MPSRISFGQRFIVGAVIGNPNEVNIWHFHRAISRTSCYFPSEWAIPHHPTVSCFTIRFAIGFLMRQARGAYLPKVGIW